MTDHMIPTRSQDMPQAARAVFISYSHDDGPHRDRVRLLCDQLRADGFNAVLDQYNENPPEGWPRWMASHLDSADFVLLICTEVYCRRVMGEEAPGVGHGAIWEGNLIYQYLYDAGTRNERFVPLLLGGGRVDDIPPPLRGATHYRLEVPAAHDRGYQTLLKRLSMTTSVAPPIGPSSRAPNDSDEESLFVGVFDAERSEKALTCAVDAGATARKLEQALTDRQDPAERYWIYVTLGELGGALALETIRAALDDPDEFARTGAIRAAKRLQL